MNRKQDFLPEIAAQTCRKLNTKEFCFICRKVTKFKIKISKNHEINLENNFNSSIRQPISLTCLLRHLKINLGELPGPSVESKEINEEVKGNLCNDCEKVIKRFSVLFQQLGNLQEKEIKLKLKLEMDYYLEQVYLRITNGERNQKFIQNYLNGMSSDPKCASQLGWIDQLRKEICNKCSKIKPSCNPSVVIPRLEVQKNGAVPLTVKQEVGNSSSNCVTSKATRLKNSEDPCGYFRDSTGKFNCKSCPKTFNWGNSARLHYLADHIKKRFKCDICSSIYTRYHHLATHRKTCRQRLAQRSLDKKFQKHFKFHCATCDRRFPAKYQLLKHQKNSHVTSNQFQCKNCDKSFKTASYLKTHNDTVHLKRTWSCKFCNKAYPYSSSCKRHQRKCPQKDVVKQETTQSNRRNFPRDLKTGKVICPGCDKLFNTAQIAHRHYDNIHLDKKVKCNICMVVECTMTNLTYHRRKCRQKLAENQQQSN